MSKITEEQEQMWKKLATPAKPPAKPLVDKWAKERAIACSNQQAAFTQQYQAGIPGGPPGGVGSLGAAPPSQPGQAQCQQQGLQNAGMQSDLLNRLFGI